MRKDFDVDDVLLVSIAFARSAMRTVLVAGSVGDRMTEGISAGDNWVEREKEHDEGHDDAQELHGGCRGVVVCDLSLVCYGLLDA